MACYYARVTTQNSVPVPSSTRNRNSTRVGAKGTSQNKFYSELGFESLKFRHWFRKPIIYTNTCLSEDRYLLQYFTAQQNWCFQVLLFPIYNIRMVKTWYENMTICNYAVFQKCLKIGRPNPKPVSIDIIIY